MIRTRLLFALLFLGGLASSASADTLTAASCASAHVQTAIDAAVSGDTINIPAGTCTWATNVGISDKNIAIIGAGIGQTLISVNSDYAFYIASSNGTTGHWRVSGITFSGNTTNAVFGISTESYTGVVAGWRIDHIRFNYPTGQRRGVTIRGLTYGVIDHNEFVWGQGVAVGISAFVNSDGCAATSFEGDLATSQPLDLGTANAVYMEDNTLTSSGVGGIITYDDSAGGGRMVFRHNTVTGGFIYSHWSRGCEIGGFLHEIYNNSFTGNADYNDYPIRLESGTGVIYNNTLNSYQTLPPYVFVDDRRADGSESSSPMGACNGSKTWDGNAGDPSAPGWPCLGQIGRTTGKSLSAMIGGDKPGSAPLYMWNNGVQAGCATGGACSDTAVIFATPAAYIKPTAHPNGDVDYVLGTPKPGYTAYTYPHPSVSGGTTPPGCSYTVTPGSSSVAAAGETKISTVGVSDASCAWTAVAVSSWLSVTGGASGTGAGSVTYVAAANGGVQRVGTLTVAANTLTVTQAASPVTDATVPALTITAPVNGATVTKTVQIRVNASDNVGVTQVVFTFDGHTISTDRSSAYTASYNMRKASSGAHVISATAYDAAGNTATASVTVIR